MRKVKIALFMLPLLTQGGGAEKYFIELARNLSSRRKVKADVITMDEDFFKVFARLLYLFRLRLFTKIDISGREKEEDVKKRLGKASWVKSPLGGLKTILSQYNVIYAKNEIVDLLLLKLIGYRNLPPVIVGIHTPLFYPIGGSLDTKIHNFLYSSLLYRWLLQGVKFVHASNSFTKEYVERNFRIEAKLIYYPFDIEAMKREATSSRTNLSFNKRKINIVFVGRLSEQKGVDILIRLIKKIAVKGKVAEKINLNIFGSGDEKFEQEIRELTKTYPWVRFFGHIEHRQIASILSKQNLLLSTSRWEVLPFNILEGQAMGLPVVAFDIAGPNDIIRNGETGFLTASETEMEKKLVNFVQGQYLFNKVTIKKNIKNTFSPAVIYPKLFSMLMESVK
ncbi:MAG TPA: glycosyltransferase family 4 protein [Patescibacteria group bacterium]|nr:glycosyltransferase family 4 protein [Patescibacteria group bacterium]